MRIINYWLINLKKNEILWINVVNSVDFSLTKNVYRIWFRWQTAGICVKFEVKN